MKQTAEKIMVQVPRDIIFGMMLGPLLPLFMVVSNAIDDPLLQGVRGRAIIRLITIGFGAGISFAGLMLFLHRKRGEVSPPE